MCVITRMYHKNFLKTPYSLIQEFLKKVAAVDKISTYDDVFSCNSNLTTSIVHLCMRASVHPSVRDHNPIHLSNQLPSSRINFLINQLYSSLAQLIAPFKTFCHVLFDSLTF